MKNNHITMRDDFRTFTASTLFRRLAALFIFAFAVLIFTPETASAQSHCGRAGQRPCRIWERIPSCNKGTVENFARDRCVAVTPCGGLNQRACKIWERIPSCRKGLAEYRGKCVSLAPDKTSVRFCNYTGEPNIQLAIGQLVNTRVENYYIARGWFHIANGYCENFPLPDGYKGYVYAYALNDDSTLQWKGNFSFYVDWYDSFKIRQDDRNLPYVRNYKMVGMDKIRIVAGKTVTHNFE